MLAAARADTLPIAVAANMQFTFADLQAAFERQSGHKLQPSFGSSGKLVSQITLGAPFSVFLSADMAYPLALEKAGFSATPPVAYATGVLVLWSGRKRDLEQWQKALAGDQVRRIAVANPATAPYGKEALRALDFYGVRTALQPKLVYAESISQANQYIHSHAVDVGFTAKSVVVHESMRNVGSWIEIPTDSHEPIVQGAVITRHGLKTQPVLARQFMAFLTSAPARALLERNGYRVP